MRRIRVTALAVTAVLSVGMSTACVPTTMTAADYEVAKQEYSQEIGAFWDSLKFWDRNETDQGLDQEQTPEAPEEPKAAEITEATQAPEPSKTIETPEAPETSEQAITLEPAAEEPETSAPETTTPADPPQATSSPSEPEQTSDQIVVDGVTLTASEARMIELLNQHRQAHGLAPVRVDQQLMDQSREWSAVQAQEDRMYHGRYNVFENVAMNWTGDPDKFFEQWKNSPGHNRNMLEPRVTRVGFSSVDTSSGASYATMQLMWD